jgi:hypothetical protein
MTWPFRKRPTWFFCRSQVCSAQCLLCREEQEQMDTRAKGSVPR